MSVRRVVAALLGCALVVLTACGSSEYHYVKNSGDNVYFKVPTSWSQVDQGSLEEEVNGDPDSATAQVAREQQWVVAYDASADPSVEHVLSVDTPTDPTVFARVSQLSPEQLSQVSLDSLRNLFLPVTSSARQQAAASGQAFEGFELIRDDDPHQRRPARRPIDLQLRDQRRPADIRPQRVRQRRERQGLHAAGALFRQVLPRAQLRARGHR